MKDKDKSLSEALSVLRGRANKGRSTFTRAAQACKNLRSIAFEDLKNNNLSPDDGLIEEFIEEISTLGDCLDVFLKGILGNELAGRTLSRVGLMLGLEDNAKDPANGIFSPLTPPDKVGIASERIQLKKVANQSVAALFDRMEYEVLSGLLAAYEVFIRVARSNHDKYSPLNRPPKGGDPVSTVEVGLKDHEEAKSALLRVHGAIMAYNNYASNNLGSSPAIDRDRKEMMEDMDSGSIEFPEDYTEWISENITTEAGMIKELIRIANTLDSRGLVREADSLDKIANDLTDEYAWESDDTWNEDQGDTVDWNGFVIDNLITMVGNDYDDYEDIEDLWQSPDLEIAEYFDGMLERAETLSGISCPARLGELIYNAYDKETSDRENEGGDDARKWILSAFRQHVANYDSERG